MGRKTGWGMIRGGKGEMRVSDRFQVSGRKRGNVEDWGEEKGTVLWGRVVLDEEMGKEITLMWERQTWAETVRKRHQKTKKGTRHRREERD